MYFILIFLFTYLNVLTTRIFIWLKVNAKFCVRFSYDRHFFTLLVISFLAWCMHLSDFFLFQIQLHGVHSPHFLTAPWKRNPRYFLLLQFSKWFSIKQWREIPSIFLSTIFLFDQRNSFRWSYITMSFWWHVYILTYHSVLLLLGVSIFTQSLKSWWKYFVYFLVSFSIRVICHHVFLLVLWQFSIFLMEMECFAVYITVSFLKEVTKWCWHSSSSMPTLFVNHISFASIILWYKNNKGC